jgi:hypothetical protein
MGHLRKKINVGFLKKKKIIELPFKLSELLYYIVKKYSNTSKNKFKPINQFF